MRREGCCPTEKASLLSIGAAMLTTKVPLSLSGPGQRSCSSEPAEIKEGSGYQSPWGQSVTASYQQPRSYFMRDASQRPPG
ncbi:hypothetical protein CesoFtcFv8_020607 [Champsocephalus esox]|uniref:Uncharacterized protein n=1 Tax=Champsocephalus esox TaxID=159716 RepID=A0AAN8BBS8_9TELE|nr:hypothetical protein CesoFtcFv8_020607 [Champsocephalus esox]